MMVFRTCDRRWPFLWEGTGQPSGRWHARGEGPVQYMADTPDGAWAEFLRHEEIDDPAELAGISRALWLIDADLDAVQTPSLPRETTTGDESTYSECRAEARRLREAGAQALVAPSAALIRDGAGGHRVNGGLVDGPTRDGRVFVVFGPRPDFIGWKIVDEGRPPAELLAKVRPLAGS